MKRSMLIFLLLILVLSSNAQKHLNRKDLYGTWELKAVNAVVLDDLKNEKGNQFMPSIYFEFKKKKSYSFYREGITKKGTFQVEYSPMGTNTLLLTDEKEEHQRLLVTFEKKNGERFLLFTEIKKRDGDAADKKIVTNFIKIKDGDLKEIQKKVEWEKKLLLEKEAQ